MRTTSRAVAMAAGLAVGLAGQAPAAFLWDDFHSYEVGTPLTQLVAQGWGGSDAGTIVTNNVYGKTGTDHVAALSETNAAVNTVISSLTGKVWTECLANESFRMDPVSLPAVDPLATAMVGVTTDGYAVVYNPALGGWDICTNDARGQRIVAGLASGVWARVSILQDYSAHLVSVFMDGRLVRQNLNFISNRDDCVSLSVRAGGPNTAYLDDVYVSNAIPPALLGAGSSTNDINGDGLPDAQELATYGSIAVLVPGDYGSITAAVAAVRPSGRIIVSNGVYAGSIALSNGVMLVGTNMTGNATNLQINGDFTAGTGVVVMVSGYFTVTGQVSVSAGEVLTLTGATNHFGSLVIAGGGVVQINNGILTADGVTLSGTFTLDSGWQGGVTPQSLNYTNDFETYAEGMPMNRCGKQGWGASSAGSVVQGAEVKAGSRAAMVEAGGVVSNTLNGPTGIVWTDLYVKDPGPRPAATLYPAADSSQALMLFVNSDNFVTIWNAGAWDVCSNDVLGVARSSELAIATTQWGRLTICQDFGKTNLALFVNGVLVRQQVPFIAASVTGYNHLSVEAWGGADYFDNVTIQRAAPADVTNDADHDGRVDAAEIQQDGSISVWPRGSVFKIR